MSTIVVNYWRCPDGHPHEWEYLTRNVGGYRCRRCLKEVMKNDLKDHTDDLQSRHIKNCSNCQAVEAGAQHAPTS